MVIPLNIKNIIRGGECISCMKCIEACPHNNAQTNISRQYFNAKLASTVAVAALICFLLFGAAKELSLP